MSQESPNSHLESLQPVLLWRHFRTFCNTPRPSDGEAAIMAKLAAWAGQRGLECSSDSAGNTLIRKPASPGYEEAPVVTLQGHVDMVTQADVPHDFHRDPILTEVRDGWLWAKGTTLGADNGVGAAAALAILDDETLVHGPLEALFTVSEETSMGGASGLQPGWIQGRYLLNLDSEARGQVYIGCAGGVHVAIQECFNLTPLAEGWTCLSIVLSGLQGGHSGVDIGRQRCSANVLLARVLLQLQAAVGDQALRLVSCAGGSMANAITRQAEAVLALPASQGEALNAALERVRQALHSELAESEPGLLLKVTPSPAIAEAPSVEDSRRLIEFLAAMPYGVVRFSDAVQGVVETSNNVGIVQFAEGRLWVDAMVRSLRDSACLAHAAKIKALATLAGFQAANSSFYPGWVPVPASSLLVRFQALHRQLEGEAAQVMVIHAGLECGIIGAKYPGLEMISFGPTILGAHSPAERVDIAAVAAFWQLLRGLVQSLATDPERLS